MPDVNHEFGGQHTDLKLAIVESYLTAFATALRPYFNQLWYIDAFAGTGFRTIKHEERPENLLEAAEPERVEQRRGSAQIALSVEPPFDFMVFIDAKSSHAAALMDLRAKNAQRRIEIVNSDANAALLSLVANNSWGSTRAVLFLDPYGMEVEWPTLEAVAATKAIDVWFLFPLAGLYRQATRQLTDIDAHKRAALTRMFGSEAWEEELYPKEDSTDLFGNTLERKRELDVAGLQRFVQNRLGSIFAKVLNPLALPLKGPQMFSLFLCISNPAPKAVALSTKLGNYILDRKRHG
jgi:three-Cys-motif partner protein